MPPKKQKKQKKAKAKAKSHSKPSGVKHMTSGFMDRVPYGSTIKSVARLAQSGLSYITGHGDYRTRGGESGLSGVPQFSNTRASKNGSIRFAHREYLMDVTSTTTFSNTSIPINPGLSGSFPFLAQIASAFEEYELHGLVYYFRTMSAVAVSSTTTALGTVAMACNYDPLSPAFANKAELENYQFATSRAPCYDQMHMVECKRSQTPVSTLFVRTGAVPSGADIRLYDIGQMNFATVGMQAASNNVIGELWVSYDVELHKPRVPGGAGQILALTDHFQLPIASVASATPLGTTGGVPVASSTIGGSIAVPTGTTYSFPSTMTTGQFLFLYQVTGASTTLTNNFTPTVGTNLSTLSLFNGDTNFGIKQTAGAVSIVQWNLYFAKFNGGTAAGQSTWTPGTAGTMPGTISGADLFITTLAPGLVTLLRARMKAGDTDLFRDFQLFLSQRGPGAAGKALTGLALSRVIPMSLEESKSPRVGCAEDPLSLEDTEEVLVTTRARTLGEPYLRVARARVSSAKA